MTSEWRTTRAGKSEDSGRTCLRPLRCGAADGSAYGVTRRAAIAALAGTLARAAATLPANRNVKWALGTNLWNSFPRVPFTDILDVMRDTGFIGARLTQFPQILQSYNITLADMEREVSKRGLHVITISFNGPTHDPARRAEVLASARRAMEFLKTFGADRLVVFSPARSNGVTDGSFRAMCECFNRIGEAAGEMGFRAGLHNHLGQFVESSAELDRCMELTDPKLFSFSPDTAHLHLAGIDVVRAVEKYKSRLMLIDYKDARQTGPKLTDNIFDLGDGEIDFPGCHRVLKSIAYKGWICVDLDTARAGPRRSYERCGAYVVSKVESIYV
jgi:sugar phosphate isomerase/epimerase